MQDGEVERIRKGKRDRLSIVESSPVLIEEVLL
jgi:hypothetical protein